MLDEMVSFWGAEGGGAMVARSLLCKSICVAKRNYSCASERSLEGGKRRHVRGMEVVGERWVTKGGGEKKIFQHGTIFQNWTRDVEVAASGEIYGELTVFYVHIQDAC